MKEKKFLGKIFEAFEEFMGFSLRTGFYCSLAFNLFSIEMLLASQSQSAVSYLKRKLIFLAKFLTYKLFQK
jgi:hypothetical protein